MDACKTDCSRMLLPAVEAVREIRTGLYDGSYLHFWGSLMRHGSNARKATSAFQKTLDLENGRGWRSLRMSKL